ncbi:MAG: hypothetical protein AB1801_12075 [Chloroflexota bacterium]
MTPPLLLAPLKRETFFHLEVPGDFYWLCREPVVLAGMAYPSWPSLWAEMYAVGLRHVVCLTADEFPYDPDPLNPLDAVALQDLFGGRLPVGPDRERECIYKIARQAAHRLEKGEGVVVHCAGRTGTVPGCVLRALGFEAVEVLRYLNALHQKRGHDGWPESGWQATVVEEFR